ncbi:MAG: DUF368 domain-containing protein [Ruminococcaceae bacterium]|nr:DUF368 domain-containing protein [Oscillospiraceae bacterium]
MKTTRIILNGAAVGAGMCIPGFSGGTLAMLLGTYDELLYSTAHFQKDIRKHSRFLGLFAAGGAVGLLIASLLVSALLSTPAEMPLRFAFLGAAIGCIPPMMHDTEIAPVTLKKLPLILCGAMTALLISLIPTASFTDADSSLLQIAGGVLIAAALVLPGISASQMLYVLGLYEPTLRNIAAGNIIALLPLAVGVLLGIILTAKLLCILLERYKGTYLVILGFMLFSLKEMIPPCHNYNELFIGALCCAIGFVLSTLCTKKSK